jgi:hypothetical protein
MLAADEQSLRDPPPTLDNDSLKTLEATESVAQGRMAGGAAIQALQTLSWQAAQRSERYKP